MKKDNEIFERMKLLTNYNPSKTLNENKQVIFEENTANAVYAFNAYTEGTMGTYIPGIIQVLNSIKDKTALASFFSEIKNKKQKSFEQIINDEFESDNHKDAADIALILKQKFDIDVQPGIKYYDKNTTTWRSLGSADRYNQIVDMYPSFNKTFKITNFNWVIPNISAEQQPDSNKKDGYDAYMATVGIKAPAPAVTQTAIPQKYDDVLNGKGLLKLGSESPAVGELQQKLIKLGYTTIVKPTNYYGNLTKNAVLDFQTKQKLGRLDGILGTETANRINQILNQSAATTTTPNDRGLRNAVQSYRPKGL